MTVACEGWMGTGRVRFSLAGSSRRGTTSRRGRDGLAAEGSLLRTGRQHSIDRLGRNGTSRNESVRPLGSPVVFVPWTWHLDEDRTRATILDWFDQPAWGCAPVEDFGPPAGQPPAALAGDPYRLGGAVGPPGPDDAGASPGRWRVRPLGVRVRIPGAGPVHPQGELADLFRVLRAGRPRGVLAQDGRLPPAHRDAAGNHARVGRRPAPGQSPQLRSQSQAQRPRGCDPAE